VRNLEEEEILGVVGHELGHARHHHLAWILLFNLGFLGAIFLALNLAGIEDRRLGAVGLCVAMALYLRFGYGYVSRRFERQADLHALELLGKSGPLVRGLERLSALSGGIRNAKSWHHHSIAARIAFLQAAEADPSLAAGHHRVCARLRRRGLAFFLLVIAGGGLLLAPAVEKETFRPAGALPGRHTLWAHWARIERYVPEDFEAPATLAKLALGGATPPGEPPSAAQAHAEEALARARSLGERSRAEALFKEAAALQARPGKTR
ncbi:MAG: M48 family metalloprotease, partial [Planctomycetota bacterium]